MTRARPCGLDDVLFAGCQDSVALDSLRAAGYVPWGLFEREQAWRVDLQQTLDQILDPGYHHGTWPASPETVHQIRAHIEQMCERVRELERQRDRLVEQNARLRSQREELAAQARASQAPRPPAAELKYDGIGLEQYLFACREYAIRAAITRAGTRAHAARDLQVGRSTFYRYCEEHGITKDNAP